MLTPEKLVILSENCYNLLHNFSTQGGLILCFLLEVLAEEDIAAQSIIGCLLGLVGCGAARQEELAHLLLESHIVHDLKGLLLLCAEYDLGLGDFGLFGLGHRAVVAAGQRGNVDGADGAAACKKHQHKQH